MLTNISDSTKPKSLGLFTFIGRLIEKARFSSWLGRLSQPERNIFLRDCRLSPSDAQILVGISAGRPDGLLEKRMKAIGLDRCETWKHNAAVVRDMETVCMRCSHWRRCGRDLDKRPDNGWWQDYCPNASTLKALSLGK